VLEVVKICQLGYASHFSHNHVRWAGSAFLSINGYSLAANE
jgi:hypothetical protein